MSDHNTGGPAFPSPNNVRVGEYTSGGHEGMTLRDYFAAKAMQALISVQVTTRAVQSPKTAYEWADAMLKEREK